MARSGPCRDMAAQHIYECACLKLQTAFCLRYQAEMADAPSKANGEFTMSPSESKAIQQAFDKPDDTASWNQGEYSGDLLIGD
eukprot:g9958.t1